MIIFQKDNKILTHKWRYVFKVSIILSKINTLEINLSVVQGHGRQYRLGFSTLSFL